MDVIEFARLGGQARAKSLSASRRKEIAISASHKRWGMLASKDVGGGLNETGKYTE
jgi:predicted porin